MTYKKAKSGRLLFFATFILFLAFALLITTRAAYARYQSEANGSASTIIAVQRMEAELGEAEAHGSGGYIIPLYVQNYAGNNATYLSETEFACDITVHFSSPLPEGIQFVLRDQDGNEVAGTFSADRKSFTASNKSAVFGTESNDRRRYDLSFSSTNPNRIKDYAAEISATVTAIQVD